MYFPQLVVIHTVKDFSVVNEAKVDVFLKFSCFFDDPTDLGSLISGSSALNILKKTSQAHSVQPRNHVEKHLMLRRCRRQGGRGAKHLEWIPDLRFSSSACTSDAALDKTSSGVSIPGWSLEGKRRI